MNKRFWIVTILLVVGLLGFVWFGNSRQTTEANPAGNTKPPSHVIGKPDAAVSLVEYSDFQCPACAAYYPVVEQVIKKYQDRIRFEYRHYPLSALHQNAYAAARASEAAAKQGKFWEMYRLLFTNQESWATSGRAQAKFESYAKQLNLDSSRFVIDFADSQTNSAILASIKEFNSRGLPQSTPTFLLNGQKITPQNNLAAFSQLIDEALGRVARQ